MTNFLTGTNRGLGGLRVDDASTDVFGVNHIVFAGGATLVDNSNGKITVTVSGGGGGGMTTWTVAGASGSTVVNNGETVTITGSSGITTAESGRTVTVTPTGVLEDLNTLGAPTADGEFIVATGAGAFAYESGATARTSLGLGTIATQDSTGIVFTPQATNPETTNPLDTIWLNSETGHLMRGERDTESTVHFNVRNDEGATIPLGAPLYSKGEIGGSDRIKVGIADASDPAKMPAIGIAMEELNTTSTKDGNMILTGVLNENITITGVTERDIIYVAPHGGIAPYLTVTRPTSGSDLVQNVGVCVRQALANISQGIYVSAIGRSNDIPNGVITTDSADADYVYIDHNNTFKKITPADLGIGGGGGGGTVNSATQYQVAYYATTGTAVSGNANMTFQPTGAAQNNRFAIADDFLVNGDISGFKYSMIVNPAGGVGNWRFLSDTFQTPATLPAIDFDSTKERETRAISTTVSTFGQQTSAISSSPVTLEALPYDVGTTLYGGFYVVDEGAVGGLVTINLNVNTDVTGGLVTDTGVTGYALGDQITIATYATVGQVFNIQVNGVANLAGGGTQVIAINGVAAADAITNNYTVRTYTLVFDALTGKPVFIAVG